MLRFAGSIRRRFDIPPSPHSSASRIAPRSYRPGDAAMRGRPFEGYYLFLTYCGGELRRIPLLGTWVNRAAKAHSLCPASRIAALLFSHCSGSGRNHRETWAGCIVSLTTPISSAFSASKSVSSLSLAVKASRVFLASYFLL